MITVNGGSGGCSGSKMYNSGPYVGNLSFCADDSTCSGGYAGLSSKSCNSGQFLALAAPTIALPQIGFDSGSCNTSINMGGCSDSQMMRVGGSGGCSCGGGGGGAVSIGSSGGCNCGGGGASMRMASPRMKFSGIANRFVSGNGSANLTAGLGYGSSWNWCLTVWNMMVCLMCPFTICCSMGAMLCNMFAYVDRKAGDLNKSHYKLCCSLGWSIAAFVLGAIALGITLGVTLGGGNKGMPWPPGMAMG